MQNRNKITKLLGLTALALQQPVAGEVLALMAVDLEGYPDEDVAKALNRLRRDGSRFTVSEIVKRLPKMWPGAEQAWAMFPKSEYASSCVTSEMLEAWAVANGLDEITGRMAFRETYNRAVSESQAEGRRPEWRMTLGHDPDQREEAVLQAVGKGLLSVQAAMPHLPNYNTEELRQLSENRVSVTALITNQRRQVDPSIGKLIAGTVTGDDAVTSREVALERLSEIKRMLSGGAAREVA